MNGRGRSELPYDLQDETKAPGGGCGYGLLRA